MVSERQVDHREFKRQRVGMDLHLGAWRKRDGELSVLQQLGEMALALEIKITGRVQFSISARSVFGARSWCVHRSEEVGDRSDRSCAFRFGDRLVRCSIGKEIGSDSVLISWPRPA